MSKEEERKPSLFGSLPGYEETVAREMGLPEGSRVVEVPVCGGCERPRPDVRTYSVPHIVFLLVFFYWRVDEVQKCPRCMRNHLLAGSPLALILANVLAPVVLIWWFVLWLRTYRA
jgi:hypothetical protein